MSVVEPVVPPVSFAWLRPFIPKRLQPHLRGLRKRLSGGARKLAEPYRTVFPYIQAHPIRQRNLVELGETIERENIPGAIVECGVLDGGTAALMAWATRQSGRPVHLFDAWRGLPDITPEDGAESEPWTGEVVGSPARALSVMCKLGIPRSRVTIHRGWFHETFSLAEIPQVALLHIDCDFYEPAKLCLEKWYPVLSRGGFVQLDDYSVFPGFKKAVDEFLSAHREVKLEAVTGQAQAFYFRKPLHA
jgi:O-methyltransferase